MKYSDLTIYKPGESRVALVTGGTGALGVPVVKVFLENGWRVAFQYRNNQEAAREMEQKSSDNYQLCKGYCFDWDNSEDEAGKLVSAVENDFGGIDAVIHCAAIPVTPVDVFQGFGKFMGYSRVGTKAFLDLVGQCSEKMVRKQCGVIVGVLSEAILKSPVPGWSAYSSSKMALAAYLRDLSAHFDPFGVRVVGVLPGAFVREAKGGLEAGWPEETLRVLRGHWPIGIKAGEVANFIFQIVRDEESYKNGSFHAINAHEGVRDVSRFGFFGKADQDEIFSSVSRPGDSDVRHQAGVFARQLETVFRRVFDLGADDDVQSAQLGVWSLWDSLKHIEVLMAVEEAFGLKFEDDQIGTLISFRKILDVVEGLSVNG